ncbi:Cyanovirin-N [Leucogyrophana mollusca]|uniref:Cyanovirin-N n=1 Tax=Leucogyrophana mollusca TaxID=85980 RepID=A0ACB8B5H4_9AGAM|nr:Cyanovirin-N [Leucogyrophana mollusca]
MHFTLLPILTSGFLLFAASGARASGFASTCNNIALSGTTLSAECGNGHGESFQASINTDDCIANYGGSLTCAPNGGYSASCNTCFIEPGTTDMLCDCRNGSGGTPASLIDLSRSRTRLC